jgi:hypothetical protein
MLFIVRRMYVLYSQQKHKPSFSKAVNDKPAGLESKDPLNDNEGFA